MSASDELAKTETQLAHYYAHVSSGDAERVESLAAELEETARALDYIAGDLGVEGPSADAAWEAFHAVVRDMRVRADEFTAAANVARAAYSSLMRAKAAYQELPAGSIGGGLRSAILEGGRTVAGPVGELVGDAAVDFLDGFAARAREDAAERALATLTSEMAASRGDLPQVRAPQVPEGPITPIDINSLFGDPTPNPWPTPSPTPYPRTRQPITSVPGGQGTGGEGGGGTVVLPPGADPDGPGGTGGDTDEQDPSTGDPKTGKPDPQNPTSGTDPKDKPTDPGSTTIGGGGVGGSGGDGTGFLGGAGGLVGGGLALGGAAVGAVGLGRALGLGVAVDWPVADWAVAAGPPASARRVSSRGPRPVDVAVVWPVAAPVASRLQGRRRRPARRAAGARG